MKRVLLDQGLSPAAAAVLRSRGWEAVHVRDVGKDRADDADIIEYARQHQMVCATLDHDFHSHLAKRSATGPSVVFLRVEGMNAAEQASLIDIVWRACGEAIENGAAVSADRTGVRFRKLPLG